MTYLYGLTHSNKDLESGDAFGKNTFTTAFPIALANYLACEKNLPMNYIVADLGEGDAPTTKHKLTPLKDIIGCDPYDAEYHFEDSFEQYSQYAVNEANRSDIVVKNRITGDEVSAFEVKLVAVPTSGTVRMPRDEQCCELVVRPPSIEQLCFSFAASFGPLRRQEVGEVIVAELGSPIDYEWSNEDFMKRHRSNVLAASNELIRRCIPKQKPLVLIGEWRTQGQEPVLDNECYDVFFFSNAAFLQLFTSAMKREIATSTSSIGRPARALIWFIKSMFDYSAQGRVTFERTHSLVTFGGQTDKAGSFTSGGIRPFIKSKHFIHPRISVNETNEILLPEGAALLKPERRLDAVLIHRSMEELLGMLQFGEPHN